MDDDNIETYRFPQLSVVLPHSSTEDDAKEAATDIIENGMELIHFEIMSVLLVETGKIQTPGGTRNGKRYLVAFRETDGEVIYIHPDYYKLVQGSDE